MLVVWGAVCVVGVVDGVCVCWVVVCVGMHCLCDGGVDVGV